MTRLAAGFLMAALLAALAAMTVDIETDASGLIGTGDSVVSTLDTVEGRSLILAVRAPDAERRSDLAREIAKELSTDPMVARTWAGPTAPPPALLAWLWDARFRLAPPAPSAFEPDALASEFVAARRALTGAASSGLAHYLLLDPTGSFRRLVETLRAATAPSLPLHAGVPQALDRSAAVVTIELAAKPFDAERQRAFDRQLTERVAAGGAEALIMGPRSVTARVSAEIRRNSRLVAGIGGATFLVWLYLCLRSSRRMARVVLPVALGFPAAVLIVDAAFGAVHVLALGFGGALLGMAMDYPLHLLSHQRAGEGGRRARSYVLLGAATTSIAFLALIGTRIGAIGQVGLFVASGLIASAVAAIALEERATPDPAAGWTPRLPRWTTRWKLPALSLLAAVALLTVVLGGGTGERRLFELPPSVVQSIAEFDRMMDLPSGRHAVEIEAETLEDLLVRYRLVGERLRHALERGWIGRAHPLLESRPEELATLPSPEEFADLVDEALAAAGFRDTFRPDLVSAYREALARPPITAAALRDTPLAQTPLIRLEGGGIRSTVRLWDVVEPGKVAEAVAAVGGTSFIDREMAVSQGLDRLTRRILVWFGIGVVGCGVVLLVALRRRRSVADIMLSCLAGTAVTAAVLELTGGAIGVFELMGLALVVGIGIDYGIFLTLAESEEEEAAATRSVMLCASTTLTAFLTMALFGTGVLRDIGTTVSLGVVATGLAAYLRQDWGREAGHDT